MPITELQQQIEAVRQEAFADGYAAAMKEVKELTVRAAPDPDDAALKSRNGKARGGDQAGIRQATPTPSSVRRRRRPQTNGLTVGGTAKADRSAARPPGQGTNAALVSEVLKAAAPKALRASEIRRALQDKDRTMSFTSIGYSLRRLAACHAARQIGHSKTWRYHEA